PCGRSQHRHLHPRLLVFPAKRIQPDIKSLENKVCNVVAFIHQPLWSGVGIGGNVLPFAAHVDPPLEGRIDFAFSSRELVPYGLAVDFNAGANATVLTRITKENNLGHDRLASTGCYAMVERSPFSKLVLNPPVRLAPRDAVGGI